jgi:hypothetical protein
LSAPGADLGRDWWLASRADRRSSSSTASTRKKGSDPPFAEIWDPQKPLDEQLEEALKKALPVDTRDELGATRKGRPMAAKVNRHPFRGQPDYRQRKIAAITATVSMVRLLESAGGGAEQRPPSS